MCRVGVADLEKDHLGAHDDACSHQCGEYLQRQSYRVGIIYGDRN